MAEFRGKQGHWVTTESGSHIFIESGGSFDEAVEKAFGKENAKKYKKYERQKGDIIKTNSGRELEINNIGKDDNGNPSYWLIDKKTGEKVGWKGEKSLEKLIDDDFDDDNDFENWDEEAEDEDDFKEEFNELEKIVRQGKPFKSEFNKAIVETYFSGTESKHTKENDKLLDLGNELCRKWSDIILKIKSKLNDDRLTHHFLGYGANHGREQLPDERDLNYLKEHVKEITNNSKER